MALDYGRMAGLLIIQHCQDPTASKCAVDERRVLFNDFGNEGEPGFAETVIISRDIEIVRYLGSRIHFAHVSLRRSVELIRMARKQGIQITAEATPHHFTLTEEVLKSFDPNLKVNPPLRTADDVKAIKEALKTGRLTVLPATCPAYRGR